MTFSIHAVGDVMVFLGAVMVCVPIVRSVSRYVKLFRTRNLALEPQSLQMALTVSRNELQKWASSLNPIEYLIVLTGSLLMAIAHGITMYANVRL